MTNPTSNLTPGKTKKPKLAIFDADGLLFYASWSLKDQLTNIGKLAAKKKVDEIITAILNRTEADYFVGFYGVSSSETFRHAWATEKPYKGNRKSEPWQEFFKTIIKAHYADKWNFYGTRRLEADDAVIIANDIYKDEYEIIMVGEDKDMKANLPGFKQYNPRTSQMIVNDPITCLKFKYTQMLHGDSSDNIGGVKGVGDKAVIVKHIQELEDTTHEELFALVRDKYIEIYSEEYLYHMVENYVLLTMINKPSFDYPENVVLQKVEKKKSILKSLNI